MDDFMTLGEKLQTLRKARGQSQEQLAAQLTVSRQAVSKWELGESLPDTDKVVQLSKLFGVSTDYLLQEKVEISPKLSTGATVTESAEAKARTAFIWGMGIVCIGLLRILFGWDWWGTFAAESGAQGLLIQVIGIVVFELLLVKCDALDRIIARRKFYAAACWLILPLPCRQLSASALWMLQGPAAFLILLLSFLVSYFLSCGVITAVLRRR